MICHDRKLIFIHIPKCAGTSVEVALGHMQLDMPGRNRQDHRSLRRLERPFPTIQAFTTPSNRKESLGRIKHALKRHNNPKNKIYVSREQFKNYFKFATVRNPWTRVCSWYSNVMRDPIHQENLGIRGDISFEDFLVAHIGKGNLKPQVEWLKSFSGKIEVDQICKIENLEEDFAKVCDRLNLENIKLEHTYQGSRKNYAELYNEKTINMVAKAYSEDIKLFNYSYDLENV